MSLVIVDKDLARHERRTSAIIWLCTAALALFLIWAHFAILDEVTVGTGKVTPSSRAQVIDSLDGGIVKQLNVHEARLWRAAGGGALRHAADLQRRDP